MISRETIKNLAKKYQTSTLVLINFLSREGA